MRKIVLGFALLTLGLPLAALPHLSFGVGTGFALGDDASLYDGMTGAEFLCSFPFSDGLGFRCGVEYVSVGLTGVEEKLRLPALTAAALYRIPIGANGAIGFALGAGLALASYDSAETDSLIAEAEASFARRLSSRWDAEAFMKLRRYGAEDPREALLYSFMVGLRFSVRLDA